MRGSKGFEKEALGRLCISGRAEEEFECVSLRINGSIQINPLFLHFDVGLIDPPGVGRGLQMRSASLLQFGGIALHPMVDGGMIDVQTPLSHHLFKISITERIPSRTSAHTA